MATRLYFVANSVAPVSPALDAGWIGTTQVRRRGTATVQAATSESNTIDVGPTAGDNAVAFQVVSPPLDGAQFMGGTANFASRARELAAEDDVNKRWRKVYVVSQDGSTVRGTAMALGATSSTTELSTSLATRIHLTGAGMTTFAMQDGDRIVVEWGYGVSVGGVTSQAEVVIGGSGTDLVLTENNATGTVPWIEFSNNFVFKAEPVTVMQSFEAGAVAGAGAAITGVNAAAAGESPVSTVSLNGGTLTYTNDSAEVMAPGLWAADMTQGSDASSAFFDLVDGSAGSAQFTVQFGFLFTAAPGATITWPVGPRSTAGAQLGGLQITTGLLVRLLNPAGSQVGIGTVALTPGTRYVINYYGVGGSSSAGELHVRVYEWATGTLVDSVDATAVNMTTALIDRFRWGKQGTAAIAPFTLDRILQTTGSSTPYAVGANPSSSDAVTFSDAGTPAAAAAGQDTGTVTDASGGTALASSDAGTVTDAGSGAVAVSGADSGTVADAGTVASGDVAVSGTESGTATDAGTAQPAVAGSDALTLADTSAAAPAVTATDTATQTEGTPQAAQGSTDQATQGDAGTLDATPGSDDPAALTDAAAVAAAPTGADTSTLTDAGSVATSGANLDGTDTGVLTETSSPAAAGTGTDDAATSDTGALAATASGADTATTGDSGTVSAPGTPSGSDTATSGEASSVSTTGAGVDLAVLDDVAGILAGAIGVDLATHTDAPGLIATPISVADLATAAESGALAVVLPADDLAAAIDAGTVTVTGGNPAGSDAMAMASTVTITTSLARADVAVLVLEDSDLLTLGPLVRDISPRARLIAATADLQQLPSVSASLHRLPSAILYDVRRR